MSEFEFLRNMTIGQYLPLNSWLHLRDPRARILAFTAVIVSVTFSTRFAGLLFGVIVLASGLALARIPVRYMMAGVLPFLPMLLLIAIMQVFFNAYMDFPPFWISLDGWALSPADFVAATIVLLRFTALIIGISLTSFCLSTFELTQGLEALLIPLSRLRIPTQDFVLMVQITLRFLPILAQSAERIAKAQVSRGARWGGKGGGVVQRVKQFYPLLLPLFLTSLRRAENLALAMDARGYSASNRRTILADLHFGWWDFLLVVGAFSCAVTAILL